MAAAVLQPCTAVVQSAGPGPLPRPSCGVQTRGEGGGRAQCRTTAHRLHCCTHHRSNATETFLGQNPDRTGNLHQFSPSIQNFLPGISKLWQITCLKPLFVCVFIVGVGLLPGRGRQQCSEPACKHISLLPCFLCQYLQTTHNLL